MLSAPSPSLTAFPHLKLRNICMLKVLCYYQATFTTKFEHSSTPSKTIYCGKRFLLVYRITPGLKLGSEKIENEYMHQWM